jgi:hypothetical protein
MWWASAALQRVVVLEHRGKYRHRSRTVLGHSQVGKGSHQPTRRCRADTSGTFLCRCLARYRAAGSTSQSSLISAAPGTQPERRAVVIPMLCGSGAILVTAVNADTLLYDSGFRGPTTSIRSRNDARGFEEELCVLMQETNHQEEGEIMQETNRMHAQKSDTPHRLLLAHSLCSD